MSSDSVRQIPTEVLNIPAVVANQRQGYAHPDEAMPEEVAIATARGCSHGGIAALLGIAGILWDLPLTYLWKPRPAGQSRPHKRVIGVRRAVISESPENATLGKT